MNRKALKSIGIDGKLARQVIARNPKDKAEARKIADELFALASRSTAKPIGNDREICGDCGLDFDKSVFGGCNDCIEE